MAEEQHEVWENATKGKVAIKMFDVRGRDRTVVVSGGRKFNLTPRERQMNQDMAANEKLDIFVNGALRPIRLIEGDGSEEDVKKLTENPNHISDEEMKELLRGNYHKIDAQVSKLTNLTTLERMLELAQDESINATVRTVGKLKERIAELSPSHIEETTPIATANDAMAGGIKPVTPK